MDNGNTFNQAMLMYLPSEPVMTPRLAFTGSGPARQLHVVYPHLVSQDQTTHSDVISYEFATSHSGFVVPSAWSAHSTIVPQALERWRIAYRYSDPSAPRNDMLPSFIAWESPRSLGINNVTQTSQNQYCCGLARHGCFRADHSSVHVE